ncbi:MAG: AAA family ATPase [Acidobacteria bacterium]|nr:AAA family ATPase [Acidobacteriota bacterium]MDA1236219.1 AAA family ATPase [Acidobacteriota bacterium]
MLVGLTGTNGAGKTSGADYLQELGFHYLSLSDEIRLELADRNESPTRENLTRVGNELRARFGASVLARRAIARLAGESDYVIDSIRNPSEVAALRELPGFRLVHFDAPLAERYRRAVERKDERTPLSFEEFSEQEQREMESPDQTTQQLRATFRLADETLLNSGSLAEMRAKLDRLIARGR